MMKVVISPIARRLIAREASASVDGRETGGLLLGFDPDRNERIVITQAGDPGPAACQKRGEPNRARASDHVLANDGVRSRLRPCGGAPQGFGPPVSCRRGCSLPVFASGRRTPPRPRSAAFRRSQPGLSEEEGSA